MGIDCDAKLIIGWQVDYDQVVHYLQEHKVGSCDGDNSQCFCGDDCWENRAAMPLPNEFTFKSCSPYFDCSNANRNIFLTLKLKDGNKVEELSALLASANWDAARKIAVELGAKDEPATLSAQPHIW
jgi:hypothetical protein